MKFNYVQAKGKAGGWVPSCAALLSSVTNILDGGSQLDAGTLYPEGEDQSKTDIWFWFSCASSKSSSQNKLYKSHKHTSFSLVFHVNLQCILSGMNYIVALGQTQQKNCVGLYVRQQKVNGRLRIPDAALTLLANTHTHRYIHLVFQN